MYPTLRNIHLICGMFALPMLLMYAVSAVQMAHSKWFNLKPAVLEKTAAVPATYTDGRLLARHLMDTGDLRGEINSIQATPAGFNIRVTVPGTVHEIRYDRNTRQANIRTSVSGVMGMLNRLHHAAGLWHDYGPLRIWAVLVAVVSAATVGLGLTGIWMWWIRRQERLIGALLLVANLGFTLIVLGLIRSAGP